MLSAKTERGVNVKNLIELSRKATRGKILAVGILTFERYRTNQKVKAKSIENSLRDDVGFKQ